MAADPAVIRAGMARFARALTAAPPAGVEAAPATTVTDLGLVPPRWRYQERYVPLLRRAKAPLYTALAKYATPDFRTIEVPRTVSEAGLSGTPADEITPIAPGTINSTSDTVTINEVEGAYTFSRKLLMGSNPQIDRIALDAMDRAWLAQVEAEAVTYFVGGASVAYRGGRVRYADGATYIPGPTGASSAALAAATFSTRPPT